jgi:hypothetical protein
MIGRFALLDIEVDLSSPGKDLLDALDALADFLKRFASASVAP